VLTLCFILLSCKWFYNAVVKGSKETTHALFPKNLFIGFGIGLGFLFIAYLLSTFGYIIGGVIGTTSVIMAIEGKRRWLMSVTAGMAITVVFSLIFGKVFHIELPAGLLSFF
jgi:hypothetical protein